ncbi:NAD(P)-dependent glycerol-3-phosphate dehydrogenase [Aliishimia ponticola]|uniref:Glycerol-3-phosphate dehydrogenase [NAD(P)+] n=1 Tax=Aliishimia ponticola TaxID=2499833 RepID=A0A4S4N8F0_9RHOB|nr:NAD(P)H-dependent glycerol-3-phosphate dehydrogenase [Aliishimia ponticola]THH34617.1 NAD(P)-dependent glycerol-3-phosphate dehydrogenase [Aliishimia ponticola]
MSIVIAGSGAFGTALAIALAGPQPVILLGRDAGQMTKVEQTRRHEARLPGATLPDGIMATANADCLADADIVLLAVPMQQLGAFLDRNAASLANKPCVACCKGVDLQTLSGPVDMIAQRLPGATPAILTGPSFAADIAVGLPTALTLACADTDAAKHLQEALNRPKLRLYRSADTTGAQLGGAVKNVIAIAAGACIGAELGESARAALVTRGFAEMQRLATALGAETETLMGLSGLGDLILTCGSPQSRNFRFGLSIGKRDPFDASITVEGAATAQALRKIAVQRGLDLPVLDAVNALVTGQTEIGAVLQSLLSRPLKEE